MDKLDNSQAKPHTEYIFIDESGDLGEHGSIYFTIVALATQTPLPLARVVKRVRERRLKKKLKRLPEIKANNSNESIRRYVLGKICLCECSISAVAVSKTRIKNELFGKKDNFYNYLCGLLFEHISLNTDILDITIDKKHSNMLLREDFNRYIEERIKQKSAGIRITIKHLASNASNELQAVDFIAWAVGRKFTYGDSSYYDIIKSKIKNQGKEELL